MKDSLKIAEWHGIVRWTAQPVARLLALGELRSREVNRKYKKIILLKFNILNGQIRLFILNLTI